MKERVMDMKEDFWWQFANFYLNLNHFVKQKFNNLISSKESHHMFSKR
jgi:hypothetical protein